MTKLVHYIIIYGCSLTCLESVEGEEKIMEASATEFALKSRREIFHKFEELQIVRGDILLINLFSRKNDDHFGNYFIVENYSRNNVIGFFLSDYRAIPPYENIDFEDIDILLVAVKNNSSGHYIIMDLARECRRLKLQVAEVKTEVNRICDRGD